MLPVIFQCNATQICSCKKLFLLQIATFALKLQDAVCTCSKKIENYRFFKHVKKVVNKLGSWQRAIIVSFQRSLSQRTYFCEKLFFPQNSKITLIYANNHAYSVSLEIVAQLASAATRESTTATENRLQMTNDDAAGVWAWFRE